LLQWSAVQHTTAYGHIRGVPSRAECHSARLVLHSAIPVICYSFYPPRSDALFSNYFEEDLLAALLLSSERKRLMLRNICLDHLSVGLSVRKVYCGKMADWIRMPLGVESGVSRGMGVLDGSGYRRRGRSSFGSEVGASHCNRWDLCCIITYGVRAFCFGRRVCRLSVPRQIS